MSATPIPSPSATAGPVDEILDTAGSSVTDVINEVVDSTGLAPILKDFTGLTPARLISLALLIVCCLAVIKVIQHFLNRILERGKIEKSLHTFLRTSVNILLWFLFALIVASALNIDVTSLVAVLSVVGLAISLGRTGGACPIWREGSRSCCPSPLKWGTTSRPTASAERWRRSACPTPSW